MENYLAGPNLIGAQAKVQAMPHSRNDLTGIEALSLNYMSPGRFIYIQHDGNLFQLTSVGDIGDKMLELFAFPQCNASRTADGQQLLGKVDYLPYSLRGTLQGVCSRGQGRDAAYDIRQIVPDEQRRRTNV